MPMGEGLASFWETSQPGLKWSGLRSLRYDGSVLIHYFYNGIYFYVLASADRRGETNELPEDYDVEDSIEGKILLERDGLCWGTPSETKDKQIEQLTDKLVELVGAACLGLIKELAPATHLPVPRTLQGYLYPDSFTLQVLTKDGQLECHRLHEYVIDDHYPPISEDKLKSINLDEDVPVFTPAQVIPQRRLHGLVFEVEVEGERAILKVSGDSHFWNSLSDELATYLKLRKAGEDLMVPKLKGIVKSHTGIIGILLGYIPHEHKSLLHLLWMVKQGELPAAAVPSTLKKKWAEQIKRTVAQLHDLGIVWGDIKTENVLIDDNYDAFVLDFGGGNTVGWVDKDKHGKVEGDMQGLAKILDVLEEE